MIKNILIYSVLFLSLSCQDNNPSFALGIKESLLQKLPSGWKVELTDYNELPFQWKGKIAKGKKLRIYLEGPKETVSKSYSDETYESSKQLVRYLYTDLEGGFQFKMMERVHPDQFEAITKEFVIILPSTFKKDRDVGVSAAVYAAYRDVILKNKLEVSFISEDFFDVKSFPKPTGEPKILIYSKKEPFYESFGIKTF